jgi:outer membrane protein assembly factor BamA
MRCVRWRGAAVSLGLWAVGAAAQEQTEVRVEPYQAEPEIFRSRLEEGLKFAALPIFSYSTDEGIGLGAEGQLTQFGNGEQYPFVYQLGAQVYVSTKGVQSHNVSIDLPEAFGSHFRLQASLSLTRTLYSQYYGVGNQSVYVPAYDSCDTQLAPLSPGSSPLPVAAQCLGNPLFRGSRYYRFDEMDLPSLKLFLQRPLSGPWSVFSGYRFRYTRVRVLYPADQQGTQDSQLLNDARAGLLSGYNGHGDPTQPFWLRFGELTGGLVFDSRDNTFAPVKGMFHDVSLRTWLHALGGQFNGWGANLTLRFYAPVIPCYSRLVFALRLLGDVMGGQVPFYMLASTGGLIPLDAVLGGSDSIRGLFQNRFQGDVKVLGNAELRYRMFGFWDLEFEAVAGLDAGRVWSHLGTSEGGGLKLGSAAGLRIAWSHAFILRFDFGIGITQPEATGYIYLELFELF